MLALRCTSRMLPAYHMISWAATVAWLMQACPLGLQFLEEVECSCHEGKKKALPKQVAARIELGCLAEASQVVIQTRWCAHR